MKGITGMKGIRVIEAIRAMKGITAMKGIRVIEAIRAMKGMKVSDRAEACHIASIAFIAKIPFHPYR